jgi:hypothetical protein
MTKRCRLKLKEIRVVFRSRPRAVGRANGNNAAWICRCGDPLPLLARSSVFGRPCYVECPTCASRYKLIGKGRGALREVREL